MPSDSRPALTVRIRCVATPDAERHQREALARIGEAVADLLIDEARAEVAAALGVAPAEIDRERGALDDEAHGYLDAILGGSA